MLFPQGKIRKDGARPVLFQITCYLCCSVFICVVLCTVCVQTCTVLLPPGVNPIAVNKYIVSCHIIYHVISYIISYIISYHVMSCHIIYINHIIYHISYHVMSYIIYAMSYHIYIYIITFFCPVHVSVGRSFLGILKYIFFMCSSMGGGKELE